MKHEGPHNPDDPQFDADGKICFGCKVGSGSGAVFALGHGAMETRRPDRPFVNRPMVEPSWEKGVVREQRPGGGSVPLLGNDGHEIGVKEYSEQRHAIEAARHRLKNDPTPLSV